MTVNGSVDGESLGIILSHEHLFVDLGGVGISGFNGRLDDPELALKELQLFRSAGGKTLVDVTTRGIRVNDDQQLLPEKPPLLLRKLALDSGLNIVMGTGWYIDSTHEPRLSCMTTNEVADELIRDVTEGVDGTDVRAGILGEIGVEHTFVTFANGTTPEAVLSVHRIVDGKIISTETGATALHEYG